MIENDHKRCYAFALLQDRSIVLRSILETEESTKKQEIPLTKSQIINPEISYVCQGENININPEDISADDNLIVIDSQNTESQGMKVLRITCLSDCWQASSVNDEHWEFIDEGASNETTDEATLCLITGSKAELEIENTEVSGNDIAPKGDMTYIDKLVSLFGKRNKELMSVVASKS